jgi:hypothetical protein
LPKDFRHHVVEVAVAPRAREYDHAESHRVGPLLLARANKFTAPRRAAAR